jgi:hypothetical protein
MVARVLFILRPFKPSPTLPPLPLYLFLMLFQADDNFGTENTEYLYKILGKNTRDNVH